MKLSKVLLGSAIALSLVFGFASCSNDDDDEDVISGNKVSVTAEDTKTSNYRAYDLTATKHMGGIMQVKFESDSLDNNGVLGFMFDYEQDSSRAAKARIRFGLAGVRIVKNGSSYQADPYISLYKDVVDIQAKNFGAGDNATSSEWSTNGTAETATEGAGKGQSFTASEKALVGQDTKKFAVTPASDGSVTVTIAVLPILNDTDLENVKSEDQVITTKKAGGYYVAFYDGALSESDVKAKFFSESEDDEAPVYTYIEASDLGYTAAERATEAYLSEQLEGYYTNVYSGKTFNGSYTWAKTYAEAEEVVE